VNTLHGLLRTSQAVRPTAYEIPFSSLVNVYEWPCVGFVWQGIGSRGATDNCADTKVSEEGGGGGAPSIAAEIPLQHMVKTMVRQAVHLQPMEAHGGADFHLQTMEDPRPEQVDVPERGCDPAESPHWSRLLPGPVDPWREELTPEQVCWQDL